MIPPVEERQNRLCRGCIHYATVLNTYPKCLLDVVRWDMEDECVGVAVKYHTTPCKYNLYRRELKELIDSGAADLRALVYIPPDLNDYDGTIRFKDAGLV